MPLGGGHDVGGAASPTQSSSRRSRAKRTSLATPVAAHIDESGPAGDAQLDDVPARLIALPDEGTRITIVDDARRAESSRVRPARRATSRRQCRRSAESTGRPWTVDVGIPTSQSRGGATGRLYQRRSLHLPAIATLLMLGARSVLRPALAAARSQHLEQTRRSRRRRRSAHAAARADAVARARAPARRVHRTWSTTCATRARRSRARSRKSGACARKCESLQQQIIRQERLAAIGVLLSGIAHELNNPLQAISGFAELLQRDPDAQAGRARRSRADPEGERARERASSATSRGSAGSRRSTPTRVYLRDVVASVVELRQRRLQRAEHPPRPSTSTPTHPTRAVFTELQQVLLNFVINAEQALRERMPRRSRASSIRTRDVDDRRPARSRGLRPGRAAGARVEAVSAVLHDQADRRGHRPRASR